MVNRKPLLKSRAAAFLMIACGCHWLVFAEPTPHPLDRAHAHNDYEHERPLLDALDSGFGSVEADIHLVDGQLLVAHDLDQVKKDRTLEALYLDPLRSRVETNQGSVHPGRPMFILLIDIKSDALKTYQALHETLARYTTLLVHYRDGRTEPGPVLAVVSGNRPREYMVSQSIRYAHYDGRLSDLNKGVNPGFMPLVSDNWTQHFTWRGDGPMSEDEKTRLASLVKAAHEQEYRLRFWAVPDRLSMWELLWEANIDLINTDRLEALNAFLKTK